MLVIDIIRWEENRAWTDWGGHLKTDLADRLQSACPSLRLTERKRLAKQIAAGGVMSLSVENPKYAESLSHILEATGAVISMKEEPNPSPQPTRPTGGKPYRDAKLASDDSQ